MISDWQKPEKIILSENKADVWLIHISDFVSNIENDFSVLDADEKKRAEAFRFLRDRESFIVAHSALRKILGQYLNLDPSSIRFQYNEFKKPVISDQNTPAISFNLSHSQAYAIVAVTSNHAIGVDIEQMKKSRDLGEIAKRFFAEEEFAEYETLPDDQKCEGFYNAWTRKEAFIKAIGQGLFCSLKDFIVNLTPGKQAKILDVRNQPVNAWQVHSFSPAENYRAAVIVEGKIPQINFFRY